MAAAKVAAALATASPHDITFDAARVTNLCRMAEGIADLIAETAATTGDAKRPAAEAIVTLMREAASLAGEVEVYVLRSQREAVR